MQSFSFFPFAQLVNYPRASAYRQEDEEYDNGSKHINPQCGISSRKCEYQYPAWSRQVSVWSTQTETCLLKELEPNSPAFDPVDSYRLETKRFWNSKFLALMRIRENAADVSRCFLLSAKLLGASEIRNKSGSQRSFPESLDSPRAVAGQQLCTRNTK